MNFMGRKANTNPPSIRLEISIDTAKTTEVSYNRLMVQTFKTFKKQSEKDEKANFTTSECTLTKNEWPILVNSVSMKRENINDLLSIYSEKLLHFNKNRENSARFESSDDEEQTIKNELLLSQKIEFKFASGDLVLVKDNNFWYKAKIMNVNEREKKFTVHFVGWNKRYDRILRFDTNDVEPLSIKSEPM
jgi:hypothetical protein